MILIFHYSTRSLLAAVRKTYGRNYRQTNRPKRLRRGSPHSPPKPTIPLIRERILGPFSRYPAVNRPISGLATKPTVPTRPLVRQKIVGPVSRYPAVDEPISRPTLNSVSSIEAELAEVRSAWARYRATNSRDAVYVYLTVRFRGRHAMAASQLRGEEFSGGPSPSGRGSADEARAIRYRDILHIRPRDRGRQDPKQMVPRPAVCRSGKACQSAPDRFCQIQWRHKRMRAQVCANSEIGL